MEILKFNYYGSPGQVVFAEVVNNLESKMWIERYREAGEFSLVAKASSGIRDKLPIGSVISHLDTTELMVVENHEIADDKSKEPEIIITGRGFESFFEQRIVGSNKNYPTVTAPADYILAADYTWNQAVTLLSDHILSANLIDDNNAIPFVSVSTDVVGTSVSVARNVKLGDLYSRLLELLSIDDLGQKIVRPGLWSPLGPTSPNVAVVIHKGVNRAADIVFSADTGEIESADYLWSNKKLKNAALISGRWVETVVLSGVGFDRRMMFVDASDLDSNLSDAPTGSDLTAMIAAMQQRGTEALAAQKEIALTKAEISKDSTKAKYRIDFNVGDLITVQGDYNESSTMRVSEYVEIEDKTGRSAYPTLAMA